MKRTFEEVSEILNSLAEYQRMSEELDATIDGLKDQIKQYMTQEQIDELLGSGGQKVYWKEQVQERFDSARFKKSEWAELYREYCKQVKVRPFKMYA